MGQHAINGLNLIAYLLILSAMFSNGQVRAFDAPHHPAILSDAISLFRGQKYNDCLKKLESTGETKDPSWVILKGICYQRLGIFDKSKDAYKSVMADKPPFLAPKAALLLACQDFMRGDFDAAEQESETIIANFTPSPEAAWAADLIAVISDMMEAPQPQKTATIKFHDAARPAIRQILEASAWAKASAENESKFEDLARKARGLDPAISAKPESCNAAEAADCYFKALVLNPRARDDRELMLQFARALLSPDWNYAERQRISDAGAIIEYLGKDPSDNEYMHLCAQLLYAECLCRSGQNNQFFAFTKQLFAAVSPIEKSKQNFNPDEQKTLRELLRRCAKSLAAAVAKGNTNLYPVPQQAIIGLISCCSDSSSLLYLAAALELCHDRIVTENGEPELCMSAITTAVIDIIR